MAEKKENLFDCFPAVTTEEWRSKVDADLKGVPFEKKLVWRTNEGFNVNPMYRAEDIENLKTTESLPGEYPYVRGTRTDNDWLTRQNIIPTEPAEANATALEVIGKGVNSLNFNIEDPSETAIAKTLENIDLEKIEVNFSCCSCKISEFITNLVNYAEKHGVTTALHGSIDYHALCKTICKGEDLDIAAVETLAEETIAKAAALPRVRVISVDSTMFNNAGAYIYQELGYAMAWGAQWMTTLTDKGITADKAAESIKFNMGVSSNYFMELAKFRAARMLWAQIVKQYNPSDDKACKMVCHAETSKFNQTVYDAHVNLLRSQTEAMSAALAGVDSITVVPFDMPYKTPDAFSERIARNQQFLLKEESHLDKVVDPAGGSYYVETLTVAIAQQAWKLFLEIVENGGFFANIANCSIQKAVKESSEKRHADMAKRKEILLGTNQYPNFNEMAAEKIEKPLEPEQKGEKALIQKRQASDFETLRLATERAANRPKVFMLTIGNLAMRLARAQFSSNFFGCAGYQIIDNIGFESIEQGVAAAKDAQADVIVLCSSDDEYAQYAPEANKQVGDKAILVVAGAPACMEELKAQGINHFIHVRSNVLETLQAFNAQLLK